MEKSVDSPKANQPLDDMKTKILFGILLGIALAGCASVTIPNYIREEHPYRKTFYASFDDVLNATVQAMEEMGWQIAKKTDPAIFERNKSTDNPQIKQILLFTDVRQTAFILGTRYARMNIYLQSATESATDVELRYLKVTSVSLKNFQNYRNDRFAEKVFARIAAILK